VSESLIQGRTDLQGLSTAILLPSVDLLGGSIRTALSPLTQVVGIGLFQRTVLTLQRAGIRQLIVLSGAEEEQLKQSLAKGPRVTIPVRWMPVREFPLDDYRTWEALASEVRGFCLLSGVGGVFSRSLVEQLRQDLRERQAIVVSQQSDESRRMQEARGWSFAGMQLADLVVLPSGIMSAAPRGGGEAGVVPVRRWLEQAARDGHVRIVSANEVPANWYQELRHVSDLPVAECRLFSSLKSEFEGFVDRYFNRTVSRWFTRLFLALGLSPNSITLLSTVIGLLAAVELSRGSYGAAVIGALLLQLAAVIDCCDGEVARLTFTESPFGAWLDIAMDNVVHMAVFGGIGVGAYVAGAGSWPAWIPLVLSGVAIGGNALSFALVTRTQKITQASRWSTPVHASWAEFMLKNVASRDFTALVLAFALLGTLDLFLWMAAAGSLIFALAMLWVVRPSAVVAPTS